MYIGGQLNVENLAGNQFINFALVGLTELPSSFIGEFFMNRIGRRWTQVICQLGKVIYQGVSITARVRGKRDLESLGQQVLITIFLYFQLVSTVKIGNKELFGRPKIVP